MKWLLAPRGLGVGLGVAGVAVLPGLIALMGICPGPAVDPALAFAEAAGAFSVLAAHAAERRAVLGTLEMLDPFALEGAEDGLPERENDTARPHDPPTGWWPAGRTPLKL